MKSKDQRKLPHYPGGDQASRAILDYTSDRSVAMICELAAGTFIGSGTCIEIGPHLLVATAGHNLDSAKSLRLLPRGVIGHPGLPVVARSHPRAEAWPRDLAWLELDSSAAHEGHLNALDLGDLKLDQGHDPDRSFVVQGYPAEEVEKLPDGDIAPLSLALGTISLPSPDSRLVVEWPPSSPADTGLQLVPPFGVSGGGVWHYQHFSELRIWHPGASKLVAITTHWSESRNQLFCEPIVNWLALLAADRSDLLPEIEHRTGWRPDV